METKNVIFKKFETIGKTKDEAKAAAAPLNLRVDATGSYNKWAKENPTNEDNVKEWMKDYLNKKKFNMPNDGAYIVLQPAVADTRERPYKYVNNVTEGKKNIERVYEIRTKRDGTVVGTASKKADAEKLAKSLMSDLKTDLECVIVYHVTEGKDLAFTLQYTPSTNTKQGSYVVFGNERQF